MSFPNNLLASKNWLAWSSMNDNMISVCDLETKNECMSFSGVELKSDQGCKQCYYYLNL